MKEKKPHRVIIAIAFLFALYEMYKSIICHGYFLIGAIACAICLGTSIMYMDMSGYLPFEINKRYKSAQRNGFDIVGYAVIIYLFYLAVTRQ